MSLPSSSFIAETKEAQPSVPYVVERSSKPSGPPGLEALLAATLDEMSSQWHAGQMQPVEYWLAQRPELAADSEAAVRLVYEEFCLREERGEQVHSSEYYRRFPQWHDALAVVLDCHHLLRAPNEPVQFPTVGQQLGDLRLLEELGRGALGRVFLAEQPSLSDRLLVVKLTARSGQEHLSLARLQHTNIVPLYLVHDFPAENLRALCMPYLGGATWANVLQSLESYPLSRRTGQQIAQRLLQQQRTTATTAGGGPAIGFLSRSTFVDAVCWVGACLADALSYAHQRGLVHLDIKPSNVLLAGDGQPMLLDFHLACETDRLQNKNIDRLGGTPGYMSPEQRAATECVKQGVPIAQPLDPRSDIYSLGVLLYESLTGKLPGENLSLLRSKLRHANPQVSRGLEDIVCKCLATTPAGRYQDAGQLAADLRLHLASLPLRAAGNHSLRERWQKWRRRKPHTLPVLAVSLAVIAIVCYVGTLFYRDRVRAAESVLQQLPEELSHQQFDAAIQQSQSAWNALRWLPGQSELKNRLKSQIAAAKQAQVVDGLHKFVEQLRFLDDEHAEEQKLSDKKLADIATGCHTIWEARESLINSTDEPNETRTNQALPEDLRRDLLDLAILSARLDVQSASSETFADARDRAFEKLNQARALCGPSLLLDLEQHDLQTMPNPGDANVSDVASAGNHIASSANRLSVLASLPGDASAWEHDGLGRWFMHHNALDKAQQEFAAAIAQQPNDFWANFQQTRCLYELGRYDNGLASASICVALAPDRAECFYNRALCQEALHHDDEALADFGRALQHDPQCTVAALARGILLLQLKRYDEAQADFQTALATGSRPSEIYYQLARLNWAKHDAQAARSWLQKSLAEDPTAPATLALQKELTAAGQ